ncbi:MAG: tetratricopeptide repeat protein, partial [Candidatus Eremiobacteraeota bacterium]|nr:tetratricopeptide repeat protein [Candidatus Eremiobacteraeota bacterium]
EIRALLVKSQLVTIVGTGGVGKTRAALQIGADLLDASGDGVWFVDFAPISGAEYVVPEIALALNIQPQKERSLLDQIRLYLRTKRLLLIFDNCEHVVGEVSRAVAAILKEASQIKVLATSREGLNTHGEQVYRMPSLGVPPEHDQLTAEEALQHSAVALFVARATAADARFSFSDDKAAIVSGICRRLDGIALAIELAAPRVAILSVQQLSQRLDERFRLLTGGDRAALPRQQTMRAAIEWSYELLSEEEKTLFRRLSIFQGGWTLEASVAVCSDESLDEFSILETLSSLANKSLVVVELDAESQRYRLLESLRQYGLERLKQGGGFEALAPRHAEYFGRFAQQLNSTWMNTPEPIWIARCRAEIDNIRVALEWSLVQRNNSLLGARLAVDLWILWMTSNAQEGMRWLEMAKSVIEPAREPGLNVELGLALSRLMFVTPRAQWLVTTERTLKAARAHGDEALLARAVFYHGETLVLQNQLDEAEPFLVESLELARRLGYRVRIATAYQMLGQLYRKRGRFDRARDFSSQGLQLWERGGIGRNRTIALVELSYLEKLEGNLSRAIELAQEAALASAQLADRDTAARADNQLALYHLELGDLDQARSFARAGLAKIYDQRFSNDIPFCVELLIGVAVRQDDWVRAARLLGYAMAATEQIGRTRDPQEQADFEWITQPLREHYDEVQLAKLAAEGAAWSEDEAVEEARKI